MPPVEAAWTARSAPAERSSGWSTRRPGLFGGSPRL